MLRDFPMPYGGLVKRLWCDEAVNYLYSKDIKNKIALSIEEIAKCKITNSASNMLKFEEITDFYQKFNDDSVTLMAQDKQNFDNKISK